MSTDSERDQSTDRILKASLRRNEAAADGGACLDAETMAAWMEGALPDAEAARVEAHLADCARCQSVMATLAASEPVSAALAPAGAPAVIPFRPRSPTRWLIPVAAGAAAASLLVWTAWPQPDAPVIPASGTMARANAPAPTPTPPAVGELASPAQRAQREATGEQSRLAKSETAPAQSKAAEEVRPADTRSRALQPTFRSAANDAAAKPLATPPPPAAPPPPPTYVPPPPAGTTAGVVTTLPPPPPPPTQVQQAPVRTEPIISVAGASDVQKMARADSNALKFAALVPGTVEFGPADADALRTADRNSTVAGMGRGGGGGAAGGAAGGAGGGGGGRSTAASELAMPLTNIRWRILPTGEVGKTTDAGATWQAITIEPAVRITNGAAPSATVCWLIGRAGVVLRSTDGIKFSPVTFPEAVDLRTITAIDARRATVTTASGRTYTTTDAGLSWKAQDLQTHPF